MTVVIWLLPSSPKLVAGKHIPLAAFTFIFFSKPLVQQLPDTYLGIVSICLPVCALSKMKKRTRRKMNRRPQMFITHWRMRSQTLPVHKLFTKWIYTWKGLLSPQYIGHHSGWTCANKDARKGTSRWGRRRMTGDVRDRAANMAATFFLILSMTSQWVKVSRRIKRAWDG